MSFRSIDLDLFIYLFYVQSCICIFFSILLYILLVCICMYDAVLLFLEWHLTFCQGCTDEK